MKIQIIGMGCQKCKKLEEHAIQAADSLGLQYELEKITRIEEMTSLGVMVTPALAIDGNVKIAGKISSIDELKELFHKL